MNGVKVFGLLTISIPLFVIVARYYSSKDNQQYFEEQEEEKEQEEEEEEEEEKEEQEEEEEKEEEEQVKVWSWAELDRNLLGEIVSRLCVTDQARFRAVCTNWLAAAHPIINDANATTKSMSLPWHGYKPLHKSSGFQIYDPLSSPNHLASQQIIKWSQFGIPSPASLYLLNVKHNWLLLSIKKPNLFFWTRRYVLLFSPFTKRIIPLPKFDYPNGFGFYSTFSTQPDSPDCIFCFVDSNQVDKIHVLTYRNGDKEWTFRQFNKHPDFQRCVTIPHIIHGILYILSHLGQVASYNILNGEFNFDRLLQDEFIAQNSRSREIKSFVLNEEMMILCFNLDVKDDAIIPGQQFVRRYDRLFKVWIPVTTLQDHVLFFNTKILNVSLFNTRDRTCNGVLPNKVYRFFDGGCLVYSLEDGQLVQFKSINSNLLEDGGDDLPECKYNYATPDTLISYWLEAPRVRSSSDNQAQIALSNIEFISQRRWRGAIHMSQSTT